MRIILPPSEGKAHPQAGPPLDLASLGFPGLTAPREAALRAVSRAARSPQGAELLRLGPSQRADLDHDAALAHAPTAPAWRVYQGVLFNALDIATTQHPNRLLIASALFGLLRHDDPIPYYRLPPAARLPELPTPKRLWGPPLREALEELAAEHLLVDLRSQPYAGWCPAGVVVRVMTVRNGRRVAVSHHNKAVKGGIARGLAAGPEPVSAADLVDALRDLGWRAEPAADAVIEVLHLEPAA